MASWANICAMHIPQLMRKSVSPADTLDEIQSYWAERLQDAAHSQPDLIVLPEACDRFDNMSVEEAAEFYRYRSDAMLKFFQQQAKELTSYIAYSAIMPANDREFYNSTFIIDRSGNIAGRYDKNYPTIPEIDICKVLPGKDAPVIGCDFGKVGCMTCFDLNFAELMQHYAGKDVDLLIYCSRYHGGLNQQFWAYNCQAHLAAAVAGAGRPATVLAPNGRVLAETTEYSYNAVARVNLDSAMVHLDGNREKLASLKAQYGSGVVIDDAGHTGVLLVSNSMAEKNISGLLQEFDIEPLKDYLKRSQLYRNDFLKITNKGNKK